MKDIKILTIIAIVLYLLGAFVEASFNIVEWGEVIRFSVASLFLIFSGVYLILEYSEG